MSEVWTEEAYLEEECRKAGVLETYRSLVRNGKNAPRFAAMLAMRQPPCEKGTDRVYWEGRQVSEFDSEVGKMTLAMAKKAGISTQGKFYVSGLADSGLGPATPDAWVSNPGDIVSVAKKKGRNVAGVQNYTAPPQEPTPDIPLAEDLVQQCIARETEKDPSFKFKKKRAQREIVLDKYGPRKG